MPFGPHPLLLPHTQPLTKERIAYLNQRFEERMAAEKFLKEQKEREKQGRKEEKKRQKERRRSSVQSGSVDFEPEGGILAAGMRRDSHVSRDSEGSGNGNEAITDGELHGNPAGMEWAHDGMFGRTGSQTSRGWSLGGSNSKRGDEGLFGALRRASKGKETRIV
jgi:hypothetical protein